MNKIIAVAALLGFAASKSVSAWQKADNLVSTDFFKADYSLEADFGYGTFYKGNEPVKGPGASNTEVYGTKIYSKVSAKLSLDILKHRQWTAEYTLVPVEIIPYQQTFTWMRPEEDGFHLYHSAQRSIRMLDYTTEIVTNVKTAKVSILDYINDDRAEVTPQDGDWTYDAEYENEYFDPYYSGNLLNKLNAAPTASWYGVKDYYAAKKLF